MSYEIEAIRSDFIRLKSQWLRDTQFLSNVGEICNNPAYLEIIKKGKEFLPFIYGDLKKDSNHWFVALIKITGENPVPKEYAGRIKKMREIWLQWLGERILDDNDMEVEEFLKKMPLKDKISYDKLFLSILIKQKKKLDGKVKSLKQEIKEKEKLLRSEND